MRVNPYQRSMSLTSLPRDKNHSSCKINKKARTGLYASSCFFSFGGIKLLPLQSAQSIAGLPRGYHVLGASVLYFFLRPVTVGSRRMAMVRGFFL